MPRDGGVEKRLPRLRARPKPYAGREEGRDRRARQGCVRPPSAAVREPAGRGPTQGGRCEGGPPRGAHADAAAQAQRAIAPRRFRPQTADSRHSAVASPNLLLDAANAPQKPGEVVVGDITYLPTRGGRWSYLASWQGKFTKRVAGWAVEDSMTEELVVKAFERAIASGAIKAGTIVHTDRGSQYVSNRFGELLQGAGCRQSMSRRGNCYDNAQAESFFSRFKAELLEDGVFEDVGQARSETFSYIEGYYNRVRRQSALGYKSPAEFERDFDKEKKGASSESFVSGKT